MYQIQGYETEFLTGQTGDNRQVLMGLLCPDLVAYFFAPNGSLLKCEVRRWNYPAPQRTETGPYQIYDAEFVRHLAEQIADWQREIGFAPKTICVEEFFDEEQYVGIKPLLAPGEDPDEDEDAEELALLHEQGFFEFYWAKDYLMAADGFVDST